MMLASMVFSFSLHDDNDVAVFSFALACLAAIVSVFPAAAVAVAAGCCCCCSRVCQQQDIRTVGTAGTEFVSGIGCGVRSAGKEPTSTSLSS